MAVVFLSDSGVVRLLGSPPAFFLHFCIGAFLLELRLNICILLSVCIFGLVHVLLQR